MPIDIFDRTIGLLQRSLDLRMQNQQVISANLANLDTPGYRAVHLEFEDGLKRALGNGDPGGIKTTSPRHLPGGGEGFDQVQAKVVRVADTSGIGDHNGVNLDNEMIDMAQNQMLYEAATQIVGKKLALLRYVIQEGK